MVSEKRCGKNVSCTPCLRQEMMEYFLFYLTLLFLLLCTQEKEFGSTLNESGSDWVLGGRIEAALYTVSTRIHV
jgi:hypothetical protein